MPLTHQTIRGDVILLPAAQSHQNTPVSAPGYISFNQLSNIARLPASFIAPVKSGLWRIGDNLYQLAVAVLEQMRSTQGQAGWGEFNETDSSIISSFSYALKRHGYALSPPQLLGPSSTFYLLYPLVARLLQHDIQQSVSPVLTCHLAKLLVGCCDEAQTFASPETTATLTWQSQLSAVGVPIQDDAVIIGLPGTRPVYGPQTNQSLYRLPAASSTLFVGESQNTPMAFCPQPIADNNTRPALSGGQTALYLQLNLYQNQAMYALSTTDDALLINTEPQAEPAFGLPAFQLNDPLRFPAAESVVMTAKAPPWRRRHNGGAPQETLIAQGPQGGQQWKEEGHSWLNFRLVKTSSLSVEEQLYRMNVLDNEGLLQPLFAPANSPIDCLSCLPMPSEPVRARSMTEMIEKAFNWASGLSSAKKAQILKDFIKAKRPFNRGAEGVSEDPALLNVATACDWLIYRSSAEQSLRLSPTEAEIFISRLLAGSPFDHNEELRMALISSPFGEVILARVLLEYLDESIPAVPQLLRTSNQQMRILMNQTQPVTYGQLGGYFTTLQDSFLNRLALSLRGPVGILPDYMTAQKMIKIAYWHQRLMEFDYPFMLLRDHRELSREVCLSPQGLLINLGLRRIANSDKISTASRKQLIALGQDLLLNNAAETLVRDFSQLETLFITLPVTGPRGIQYAADQLKRQGVLLIQYIEAKRHLSAMLKSAAGSDAPSIAAFNRFRLIKQQLYALALESLPELAQRELLMNLHRIQGVALQFVRLFNTHGSSPTATPFIGFILSSNENIDNGSIRPGKRHYFISLLPVQSDTTQPLLYPLDESLPDAVEEREAFFNHQGKAVMLARLSEDMLANSERYKFSLQNEGSLHVAIQSTHWPQIANTLAQDIVSRQFVRISIPQGVVQTTPAKTRQENNGRVYSWFRYLVNQLVYLTPLGSCKDAATDIIQQHFAPLALDSAFCLYAFAPAGSEEEQGIKSAANVIKNVLRNSINDRAIIKEDEPVLAHLDNNIMQIEQQLDSDLQIKHPVRYHLSGSIDLTALLALPLRHQSLPLQHLLQDYQPMAAWRDPLHDVLYFTLTSRAGELLAYRFDEANQLLLSNPASSLLAVIQREAHISDGKLLKDTLTTGNTQQLRMELYQQQRMLNLEEYSRVSAANIHHPLSVVADHKESGTRYYPGIKQPATDSLYQLAPAGLPEDQQLVIDVRNGRIHYWQDNVIHFKPVSQSSGVIGAGDAYESLQGALANIPPGWTFDKLWVEQGVGDRIVASWQDNQGNIQYRHPDSQGKWLLWDSRHRDIFCQAFTRPRRNDDQNDALITEIFSPSHCGYLEVPKVSGPERAEALSSLTESFRQLANPAILNKIDCAALAQSIIEEFADIWITIPLVLRGYIANIRDWRTDVRSFDDFDRFTNSLSDYSLSFNNEEVLSYEQKLLRSRFTQRVLHLIKEYERLKDTVIESRRLREEFKASKTHYYKTYILRNLKANNWLNRWFNRMQRSEKIKGEYIIKAETPEKIRQNYGFLYQGVTGALERLKAMSAEIALSLTSSTSPSFLANSLQHFFNASFTADQVQDFSRKMQLYLEKVSSFTVNDIVVVADRLTEGRLSSGCFKTPIEKLIFGDGAYSFVYNNEDDKRIYLLDFLSNQQFIEYSLAHELGHLAFEDINYVFQEEIYLKSDSILKNFTISGAAKFAHRLMSDKAFFLDYMSRNIQFATAFCYHFYAHSRNPAHKRALSHYYTLFLGHDSIGSVYQNDVSLRKRKMTPLVDYLFSQPNIQLNMAYYNPDLFCGLFKSVYEDAIAEKEQGNAGRKRRENVQQQLNSEDFYFMALLFSPLYQKHLLRTDASLIVE